jgi:undecaprenyl-diphosphatase
MNETISSVILGTVQGITEFLPVSSSGHLVLFQQFLPTVGDHVAFDLVLHIGTLLPVLWLYRGDLGAMATEAVAALQGKGPGTALRLALLLVVGSVPTAAIGLAFEDVFEALFANPLCVGIAFAVTGALLWTTRGRDQGEIGAATMTWKHALIIGTVQGLAITPGISRSGSTIAIALLLGIDRVHAARFSFLLSVPAILGAFILKAGDLTLSAETAMPLSLGFLAAAASGYLALRILVRMVKAGDFSRFSLYLWPLSAVAIAFALA